MKDADKMVLLEQVKAPDSHLYGASPPVHWLSDMTAFQTDHRNDHIPPHFTQAYGHGDRGGQDTEAEASLGESLVDPEPFCYHFQTL